MVRTRGFNRENFNEYKSNCNTDNNVLLLLDCHTTHCKNLQACEFATKNGIVLPQLPGHTIPFTAFVGPLPTSFTQAQETFWRRNTRGIKYMNGAYGRAVGLLMTNLHQLMFCNLLELLLQLLAVMTMKILVITHRKTRTSDLRDCLKKYHRE